MITDYHRTHGTFPITGNDLHETGNAQQFLMSGYLERTITWQKDEMETSDGEDILLSILVNGDILDLGN